MLVDVGELPDHQMEPLGLVELGNFLLDSKYSKIWRALDEKLIIKTRIPGIPEFLCNVCQWPSVEITLT